MVCFALMAAQIIIINAESYIALNAAVILLGFGGCGMMKEYAINTMRYCLSVAFKLFVLQLIMGISMRIIEGFAITGTEAIDLVTLIGSAVVVLALIKSLPDIAAGIINGAHVGGNSLISTGMAAGAAMFGGAVGAGMGAQTAGGGAANLLRVNKHQSNVVQKRQAGSGPWHPRSGRKDHGHHPRPRKRDPVFRHLSGHAVHRHRIRPECHGAYEAGIKLISDKIIVEYAY